MQIVTRFLFRIYAVLGTATLVYLNQKPKHLEINIFITMLDKENVYCTELINWPTRTIQ